MVEDLAVEQDLEEVLMVAEIHLAQDFETVVATVAVSEIVVETVVVDAVIDV